jgi:hypothetical protein
MPSCTSARRSRSNRSAPAAEAGAGPGSGPGCRWRVGSRCREGVSSSTASDGRALAWNLVEGINDPPTHSERAVWVDGVPHEPAPVAFDGLEAVSFADRSRLDFEGGAERSRDDNFLLIRSTYRHRFGTFKGALDGIELSEARGVMESHDALW